MDTLNTTKSLGSLAVALALLGCTDQQDLGIFDSHTGGSSSSGSEETPSESEESETESGDDGPRLDLGDGDENGENPCGEGMPCECNIPPHDPCDANPDATLSEIMGLGCPGEFSAEQELSGNPLAMGTRENFGDQGAFPAQEGQRFVVLGSGFVGELDMVYDPNDFEGLEACSQDLDADFGDTYDLTGLPDPLSANNVGDVTCEENPALAGTGDCSNTIESQLDAGSGVFDYTELRTVVEVPPEVYSLSYDLAFFSYEYPHYFGSEFNDMFIGWLESEQWTGNISFDEMGNPISLNAGYLDYKDAKLDPDFPDPIIDPDCVDGCDAPELHGTCMQGHAGTKWLTTTAAVVPGEQVTLVFSIFDQSDSSLDSYVFLDNFRWGCEGGSPPRTIPIP